MTNAEPSPNSTAEPDLQPARMRLGAVLVLMLPILTAAYRKNEELTVPDIERRISTPTEGVRRAVARLRRSYVRSDEDPSGSDWVRVLDVHDHDTMKWYDRDRTPRPVAVVKLTPAGYGWAIEAIESLPQGRRAKSAVLSKLMALPS